MKRMVRRDILRLPGKCLFVLCLVMAFLLCEFSLCSAFGQSRRLKVGAIIPEFSGQSVDGSDYKYEHGSKKVLLLSFLRAGQKNSVSAAEDLLRIVDGLECKPADIDFVVVSHKSDVDELLIKRKGSTGIISPRIILDSEYKVWGTFGIIACPTTFVADLDSKVLCVKAGHSYNFAPIVQAHVKLALGIEQAVDPEKAGVVKTLNNKTPKARAGRNLQMAKVISDKGKYEFALDMAKKALEIDPNSVDAKIMIGRLNCQLGDGTAALEVVSLIKAEGKSARAELALINGWANRRLERYDVAEKFLLEAAELNGKSPRIHFELGNLYQVSERPEKASHAYHRALVLLLGKERGDIVPEVKVKEKEKAKVKVDD